MKKKAFASFILTLSLIILNINICYCSALEIITGINAAYNAVNNASSVQQKRDAIRDWIYKNSEAAGFMFDLTTFYPTVDFLINLLPDDIVESLGSNPSEESVLDAVQNFIINNQSVSNNNIINDNSINTGIVNFANYYQDQNKYYVLHPFDMNKNNNKIYWSNPDSLQAVIDLINQYKDDYYISYFGSNLYNQQTQLILLINKSNVVFACNTPGATALVGNDMYIPFYLLDKSGNRVYYNSTGVENILLVKQYDSTNHVYIDGSLNKMNVGAGGVKGLLPLDGVYLGPGSTMGSYWQADGTNGTKQIGKLLTTGNDEAIVYKNYSTYAATVDGAQPYYFNSQVWQDFSSSQGDYTLTSSNINTVTYGDTVSYINDYHDTNNNYPDNSTVNNWIETTNNNNSGGGSGDDSGGGSGGSGSDDSGSIFDWLKTLGKAIGDLISGVGNFLSEIVAGLVDAITNLLDAITTLITGVLESLTNIFSGLIEFIFAGLPDDIRNVLSLALTVAILISVLKLIRGN